MIRLLSFQLFLCIGLNAFAQNFQLLDTTINLNEIIVQAYQYDRPLLQIPAAVAHLSSREFDRFGNSSLLPAFNTIPGVRMEERSPGSYRFSIRGSSLRSPFGVRNVKVYWNNLPFTDSGGNTYLNLIDFSNVGSAEVIKGPGGSLYGAGTGGVILLNSIEPINPTEGIESSIIIGDFGLIRNTLSYQHGTDKVNTIIQYSHQQADGYRDHSKTARDVIQYEGSFKVSDKTDLSTTILYTDLYYQTPGGLNEVQFKEDPSQARPATQTTPGAIEQKAAIYNKTFYAGFSQKTKWNNKWSNSTGVYGSFTMFENPFITNYEKRAEQNWGIRTDTKFKFTQGDFHIGAEFQHGFSPINVYDNNHGETGNIQNSDELLSSNLLIFTQIEIALPYHFLITIGSSLNTYSTRYTRLSENPPFSKTRIFSPNLSPRLALLKTFDNFSLYASISKGFSPPTTAEIFPSTSIFDDKLQTEKGTNYEMGSRGYFLNRKAQFDLAIYSFVLDETIVLRRNEQGEDYFINAGNTDQKGIELSISFQKQWENGFFNKLRFWTSECFNHYRFINYVKDSEDYSNNKITGVPSSVIIVGADLSSSKGFYANLTFTYTSEIPLNDANNKFSSSYHLLGARLGHRSSIGKSLRIDCFGGVDNLLNEIYSLGNDLNAFGGRYFNTAAPRNFYVGIKLNMNWKR